jgi:CBS domain containing-hemolysin-like protein
MAGWLLVAAAAGILISAWCAAAQAALARLVLVGPEQEKPGDNAHLPVALQAVLDDPPPYVSVLVLVRVLCEVAATVLATEALTDLVGGGWRAFLPAVALVGVVRYVFIGVGPRALGRKSAERTGSIASRLLYPVVRVLGPLPGLLATVSGKLPVGRRPPDSAASRRTELRGLVDYIERRSVIEPGEREMVRSVFELGDTIVREVMVPRTDMVFIERDKTVGQAISLALRSGFSRIPVTGENTDDVVGIAYLKDLVAWSHEHLDAENTKPAGEVMRPATYVPDSKPADELLRQMQAERSHVAIVIDEYGGTAGLVTIEDILEEIVGEIADEYDNERAPVEWLSEDTARVTARLGVDELSEMFGVTIDAEDVETVGGLLAHELGRVPLAGSTADVAGLRLTAENVAGRRNKLGTVLIERLPSLTPRAARPNSRDFRCYSPQNHGSLGRGGRARVARRDAGRMQGVDDEDLKLITLARASRARAQAPEGAAVRDETGRTYSAATVALPSLSVTALQLAVAMAASSGAERLEAAAVVTGSKPQPADLAAVRDLGPAALVFVAAPDGSLRETIG